MSLTATFSHFILEPGKITFSAHFTQDDKTLKKDQLYFSLSEPFIPHHDLIGYACATLCYGFDFLVFDLPLSLKAQEQIKVFCEGKEIKAPLLTDTPLLEEGFSKRNGLTLSFSGGFDSLAALSLMPQNTKLVSTIFGGYFTREDRFFKDFSPFLLETNFRQLGYDVYSWTSMGVGSILYAEYLQSQLHVFGSALEDSIYNFALSPGSATQRETIPFSFAGLYDARFTNGLSTACTGRLVAYYYPHLLEKSLRSLGPDGSEKFYRKWLVMDIFFTDFSRSPNPIAEPTVPLFHHRTLFGSKIASDFMAFYFVKYRGIEKALHLYQNLPYEVIYLSSLLSLDFYNKFHAPFLQGIPEDFQKEYLLRLEKAGIFPFEKEDLIPFVLVGQCVVRYSKLFESPQASYKKSHVYFIDDRCKEEVLLILESIKKSASDRFFEENEILCLFMLGTLTAQEIGEREYISWIPISEDTVTNLLSHIPEIAFGEEIFFKNLPNSFLTLTLNNLATLQKKLFFDVKEKTEALNSLLTEKIKWTTEKERLIALAGKGKALESSFSFKMGRFLTYVPRKMKSLLKRH